MLKGHKFKNQDDLLKENRSLLFGKPNEGFGPDNQKYLQVLLTNFGTLVTSITLFG